MTFIFVLHEEVTSKLCIVEFALLFYREQSSQGKQKKIALSTRLKNYEVIREHWSIKKIMFFGFFLTTIFFG